MSQRLLAELFHEDNVDGVLYHQDAVVMKGSSSDDSLNFTGSLLLIQKRPVGAKRFLKGIAFPQPNYLVWLPYSYLYCLASHLLTSNARRAIDSDQDLQELTAFTAKLKFAMMSEFEGAGGGNKEDPVPAPSSPLGGGLVIDDGPKRVDWQHTICIQIGHIHKIIRKSNIRGRRVLTLVRKETLAVEAPLIFEEGGMSKLFDELKKVCQVDIRAGDEAFLSKEHISSSIPFCGVDDSDEIHPLANGAVTRAKSLPKGTTATNISTTATSANNDLSSTHSSTINSSIASNADGYSPAGAGRDRSSSQYDFESVDAAVVKEKLYGSSNLKKGGGGEQKTGFMSAVLSIGATFARGTAKAANSLLPEDPPNEVDVNSRAEYSSRRSDRKGNQATATHSSGRSLTADSNSTSDFEFVDVADGVQSPDVYIHGDGQMRKHQEPMPPVLRMPLSNRKLAPPLGRLDWKSAFDHNVNSVRLTTSASTASLASPMLGGDGNVTSSNATNNPNLVGREIAYGGTGTLRDEETFRKLRVKAYNGAISDEIRPQVWAYLLGVFPIGSTPAERKQILDEHEQEYATLCTQWRSIFPKQEARFAAYRDHKIAIDKDVTRTDRNHPDFRDDDSVKLTQLRNVLMSYAMFNFDLGYCQGMSDILAVILMIYPDDEVMAYTVFKHLLSNKIEGNFHHEMKRNMEVHLREIQLLISRFSPVLYQHLVSVGAEGMTFTFRWLLILFKREFDLKSVMKLWDVIFASPFTPHFEAIIAAAILDNVGHQIIEQHLAYDEILKFANSMTGQFDVNDVIMVSQDFYNTVVQQLSSQLRRGEILSSKPSMDSMADAASRSRHNSTNSSVSNGGGNPTYSSPTSAGFGAPPPLLSSGSSSNAQSSSNPQGTTFDSSALNQRPTLPEIIAFLEKEKKAAEATPTTTGKGDQKSSYRNPYHY